MKGRKCCETCTIESVYISCSFLISLKTQGECHARQGAQQQGGAAVLPGADSSAESQQNSDKAGQFVHVCVHACMCIVCVRDREKEGERERLHVLMLQQSQTPGLDSCPFHAYCCISLVQRCVSQQLL